MANRLFSCCLLARITSSTYLGQEQVDCSAPSSRIGKTCPIHFLVEQLVSMMSYARFGSQGCSEVYVIQTDDAEGIVWMCISCGLHNAQTKSRVESPAEMLLHMHEHRLAGRDVPESVFEELQIEANGDVEKLKSLGWSKTHIEKLLAANKRLLCNWPECL